MIIHLQIQAPALQ